MTIDFTVSEVNIICIYKADTKSQTIENIMDVIGHLRDNELIAELEAVIVKLDEITETEFTEYVFESEYGD
jgi:hypothetical protein